MCACFGLSFVRPVGIAFVLSNHWKPEKNTVNFQLEIGTAMVMNVVITPSWENDQLTKENTKYQLKHVCTHIWNKHTLCAIVLTLFRPQIDHNLVFWRFRGVFVTCITGVLSIFLWLAWLMLCQDVLYSKIHIQNSLEKLNCFVGRLQRKLRNICGLRSAYVAFVVLQSFVKFCLLKGSKTVWLFYIIVAISFRQNKWLSQSTFS